MKFLIKTCLMVALAAVVGCNSSPDPNPANSGGAASTATPSKEYPVFSLATSEYPSWSTFMVAGKAGLVNPEKGGEYGPLEKKWGVDVVVEVKDYDPCLTLYANGTVDAVAMTNMDALNPALGRASTAICPTSTSVGADKIIAVGYNEMKDLKGVSVYGLEKSVSHYVWYRVVEKDGLNPSDFKFENLDPAPAATALQTQSDKIKVICVWNPFALQTLRTNTSAKDIGSSGAIPEEVIDMIVVADQALARDGGEKFASCLCDIYYEVNKKLNSKDQKVADATLTALGKDFSNLSLDDMRIVVKETRFYATPEAGMKLFTSKEFKTTMDTVVATCKKIGVLEDKQPTIGYDDSTKQLNFTTKYMATVK